MAGLPKPVIDRANQILDTYMKKPFEKEIKIRKRHKTYDDYEHAANIIKEIDKIDINNTTPYQALGILTKLKKRNDFLF